MLNKNKSNFIIVINYIKQLNVIFYSEHLAYTHSYLIDNNTFELHF